MKDQRFFSEWGDPGFSPARNRATIDDVIRKHELMRAKKQKLFDEQLAERSDAAASYLMHLDQKSTPLERYFGRQELARLQGKKIVERIVSDITGRKIKQLGSL